MNLRDIPEGLRYEYEEQCPCCENVLTVRTQCDNYPEYITEIFILCSCGEYIEFNLPVN